MAMNNALRSCASKLLASTPSAATRGFHSTAAKRMVGGGGIDHYAKFQMLTRNNVNGSLITPNRGFHSTAPKSMGGHNQPHFMHAKHMYNLQRVKHLRPKMILFVWGFVVCFWNGVILFAVWFQQKKARSG